MSSTSLAALSEVAERARAVLVEMLEVADNCRPDDVVAVLSEVESVGRLTDAVRVRAVCALVDDAALAGELGFTSPTDAVATVSRSSTRAARARVRVATAVRRDRSIVGAELEPQRPALAVALESGQIGVDAADLIARELDAVAPRAEKAQQAAAEQVMVALGAGVDPSSGVCLPPVSVESLAIEVRQIASVIDPDGARPREERALRGRDFSIGSVDALGRCPVRGSLMPDVAEMAKAFMEAEKRMPRFVESSELSGGGTDGDAAGDTNGNTNAQLDDIAADDRTPGQRRHDAFAALVMAAAQAEGSPKVNGSPVTVLVTVNADDLDLDGENPDALDGDPIGTMAGSDLPVSRAEVLRYMDAAGYRVVTLHKGRIVDISSQQRCFSSLQRNGIAARDGYRCFTPGCTAPHYALQAHHVIPFRDDGPTHTDNGILLCYWHHRIVDTGPWHYRMVDGVPEVRGPGIYEWTRRTPARTHGLAA